METDDLFSISTTIMRFLTAHEKWSVKYHPEYNKEPRFKTTSFSLTINNIELTLDDLKRIQEVEEELLRIDPTATEFANLGAWMIIQDDKFGLEARCDIQQQLARFWAEATAAQQQR